MSRVANLIISAHFDDESYVDAFAEWLREKPARYLRRQDWPADELQKEIDSGTLPWPYSGDLSRLPKSVWPGPRYPECSVWVGVLNGADMDLVRERFGDISWKVLSAVQLFVMDFEQFFFRLWMIRDGRLTEYSPGFPLENDEGFWPR